MNLIESICIHIQYYFNFTMQWFAYHKLAKVYACLHFSFKLRISKIPEISVNLVTLVSIHKLTYVSSQRI